MHIKLVVDGEDKRVRITPDGESDSKLLEFVAESTHAEFAVKRKNDLGYSLTRDVEYIDIKLIEDRSVREFVYDREKIIAELKHNRSQSDHGGSGTKYWDSVADIIEKYI